MTLYMRLKANSPRGLNPTTPCADYAQLLKTLCIATLFTGASVDPASSPQQTRPAQKARVIESYGKLPLSFETNIGQTSSAVKFLSRGRGYTLFLTRDEAVLALRRSKLETRKPKSEAGNADLLSRSAALPAPSFLRMQLVGANGKAEPVGEGQLPGAANYFIGRDSAKWRLSVHTYAKVRYTGIYPGIDLVYYGN